MEEWLQARGVSMKTVSLVLLVAQTTSLVLSIKYSVVQAGPRYLASTAVFWMEVMKLACALVVVFALKRGNVGDFVATMRQEVGQVGELLKLSVPSFLYTVQNNILYVAIANLDAPTYQVSYNAKILTTGLFAVLLLGRRLSRIQWASLLLLVLGVSCAQYVPGSPASLPAVSGGGAAEGNRVLGLGAVAVACVTSGFSGVYFEKVLKSSSTSLWVRNVQMSLSSVPLALLSVWWTDGEAVALNGFNSGYTWVVWQIVFNQAVGGLLVAVVIKYADNVAKAFAAAISIISSALFSAVFFGFSITVYFVVGAACVLVATYVYAVPEAANPCVPPFMRELPKTTPLPV